MTVSRRELLMTSGVGMLMAFPAGLEEGAPFALDLPLMTLDPNLTTYAAVDTSGFTTCQIRVLNARGFIVQESKEWRTEPDVPNGAQLDGRLQGETPARYAVRIVMRPTRRRTPSVAVALTQGKHKTLARSGPAEFRNAATKKSHEEIEQVKEMALRVRFVGDPARSPGGQFEVDLTRDSSVSLRIWAGETATGIPVYKKLFANLPSGRNPIPWDLRTLQGIPVPAGRYVAFLLCRPATREAPIRLASYFGVAAS